MSQTSPSHHFRFQANDYPLKAGLRLIEASAGTGKTFALAHLVLRLITEGNHDIKRILVVTFTEAAAAELRAKIGNRLNAAFKGLEAQSKGIYNKAPDLVLEQWLESNGQTESKRLLWKAKILEALEDIDRADITTIHGFCLRTLRRHALESGSNMNPQIEEDRESLITEIAHEYWKKEALTLNPYNLTGLKQAGLDVQNLANSLLKVDSDPSLNLKVDITELDSSKALGSQFDELLAKNWRNFLHNWEKGGEELEILLRNRAEEWRSKGFEDTKPFSPKPTKNRFEVINKWIDSIHTENRLQNDSLIPSYGIIREQTLLANYFHPGVYVEVAKRCGINEPLPLKSQLQSAIASLWDGPAEHVWNHALICCLESLKKSRNQRGVMSYGNLLSALDPCPQFPLEIRDTPKEKATPWISVLRLRYQVALIDEFQDTDPVQWRILKESFGKSSDHLLLMVGDPKQAIYQFRGGNLKTYFKARKEVDRIDALLDNFRTEAQLMYGLNQLMATGLRRSGLEVPFLTPCSEKKPLTVPDDMHPLQVLTIEEVTGESHTNHGSLISKTKMEEKIPIAVANAVLDLLETYSEELNPSDICILVNRHDQATTIKTGLAQAGVPSKLVSQGDVLKGEAAQILQRFLDCLANPSNTNALRLLACSALLQWNTEQLSHSESNGELDKLAIRFLQWSKDFKKIGVLGCLSELLKSHTRADLSERGRILSDLQQCAHLLQEEVHEKGMNASRAAEWLKRQRLSPLDHIPDNRQPYSDIVESAVNVLTIHRSKGMEYRVVICPYLWQTPPRPNGPLWQFEEDSSWQLAINSKWNKGREAADRAKQAALQEAERLTYVALTRACERLIFIWARAVKQEGSPLTSLLFGPESIGSDINKLSATKMEEWLNSQNVAISILPAQLIKSDRRWRPPKPKGNLILGPTPKRQLDSIWGRYSYSAWISKGETNNWTSLSSPIELEEGRDSDPDGKDSFSPLSDSNNVAKNSESEDKLTWSNQGPFGKFPRGVSAGNCLHQILERIDFCMPLDTTQTIKLIEEELQKAGLEISLSPIVQEGLTRVLTTPLGGPLGTLSLNQLNKQRRIHELSFDLPIAQGGNSIRALDLANAFEQEPMARFGAPYTKRIAELKMVSRGFLTGSIDLVFSDQIDPIESRWWVIDWKSNWISDKQGKEGAISCGPIHYNVEAMQHQMLLHHYPLQAHLYLVALHRFLQWRLAGYNPNRHLGGYAYIFLRGIPEQKEISNRKSTNHIPGLIIEPAPVKRIMALDQLLQEGGR